MEIFNKRELRLFCKKCVVLLRYERNAVESAELGAVVTVPA